jgi:hypothetical protein
MDRAVSLNDFVGRLQPLDDSQPAWIDRSEGRIVDEAERGDRAPDQERFERLPVVSVSEERAFAVAFRDQVEDPDNRRRLSLALERPDAVEFETALYRCKLAHEWFRFRDRAVVELARSWLEERGIPFVDDLPAEA